MSSRAYANVKTLVDGIENIFASAVCSGIAPDARHKKRGGYHCSREDNPPHNFSVVRPDDRAGKGPDDAAAAFDISMNRRDMIVATRRLIAIWADPTDPRRKYLNAFNGWLGVADAKRYDVVKRTIKKATKDHTWHLHGEIRRLYVLSAAMVKAVLSALRGQSKADYLLSVGVKPSPAPPSSSFSRGVKPPAVPRYPGRVLRAGSGKADAAVKTWQAQMLARGWKSLGKADGVFGPKTLKVVRRYQQHCKVTVDGEIGPKTWPLPWRPLG